MMGPWMMSGSWNQMTGLGWFWFGGIVWLITWILVIAVLVALLRWLWKKGDK